MIIENFVPINEVAAIQDRL